MAEPDPCPLTIVGLPADALADHRIRLARWWVVAGLLVFDPEANPDTNWLEWVGAKTTHTTGPYSCMELLKTSLLDPITISNDGRVRELSYPAFMLLPMESGRIALVIQTGTQTDTGETIAERHNTHEVSSVFEATDMLVCLYAYDAIMQAKRRALTPCIKESSVR